MKKKKDINSAFEKFLIDKIREIKDIYGVGDITVELYRSDSKSGIETRKFNHQIPFSINYCPVYKRASIWYYPAAIEVYKNKEYDILIQGITHEISHILTEKIAQLALNRFVREGEVKDEIEHLTETIAQIGRKLLK